VVPGSPTEKPKRQRDDDFTGSVNKNKLEREFYYCCRPNSSETLTPSDVLEGLEKIKGQSNQGTDDPADRLGPELWEKIKAYEHTDNLTWDTVLHAACVSGQEKLAAWLVKYGMPLDTRDGTGRHALHVACTGPFWQVGRAVSWLCQRLKDTDLDCTQLKDQFGNSALHVACSTGKTEQKYLKVVSLLMDSHEFSPFAQNAMGETPLHMASEKGNLPLLQLLMEKAAALEEGGQAIQARQNDEQIPAGLGQ
jgi:hypothetical protein